jgi:PAS domain S-box-containing protein
MDLSIELWYNKFIMKKKEKTDKKCITFLVFLFFIVIIAVFPLFSSSAQIPHVKNVLVLNSYHPGYGWSDDIIKGIESVLGKLGDNIDIYIEYMDTKMTSDDTHFQNLFRLYLHKYSNSFFDVIIGSDNNAFDFLLEHRSMLFPGVPLVFCGVNDFKDSMLTGHKYVTGVVEEADFKGTIDIALKLHPETRNVYVISDQTRSGRTNTEKLRRIIPDYKGSLHFTILDNLKTEELKETLKNAPIDSIVLFFSFARDRAGNFFSTKEQSLMVTSNPHIPVYTCWDHRIQYGVVGGKVISGYYQGKTAGEMALRILNGEKAEDIPIMKESSNRYIFNYKQLQHFHIKLSALPDDSIILNRPLPFYSVYKEVMWAVVAIIVFLMLSVFSLLLNILKRKRAETALIESERSLKEAQEIGKIASWSVDVPSRKGHWSDEFFHLLGYQVGEVDSTFKQFLSHVHPDDKKLIEKSYEEALKDLSPLDVEFRFFRKDGELRFAHSKANIERDKSQKPKRVIGTLNDITERKRAEEIIKEREATLKSIFRAAPAGMGLLENRIFQFVNERMCEMTGYSKEELVGKSSRLLYESDEEFNRVGTVESREIKEYGSGSIETRFLCKDGRVLDILLSSALFDPKDFDAGTVFTALDITERKKAEEEIKRKTEQLESLYEIGKKITSITSKDELLPWITEEATSLLNADACYYRIREGDYLVYGSIQKGLEMMLREKIKIGEGISGYIAKEKRHLAIPDNYYDDKRHFPEHREKARECGFRSCLGVPMKIKEKVIGVLVVLSKNPKEYTEEEIMLLSSFADQAAIAIENAQLFKELKQRISEQKKTEEALRGSETRLIEAQKIARVGSWDRNFSDNTAIWSDEVYCIYGISRESYDGTFEAFLKIVHPHDRELVREAVNSSLSSVKPLDIVFRIIRSDGAERIVNSKGEVYCNYNGKPYRMVGTIQDITEMKETEEKIKKSLEEKQLLLQEIHHRVKNNMQVISSMLALQTAYIKDKKTIKILEECQNRIKSMALIHEKLYATEDFSRIDFREYIDTLSQTLFDFYKKGKEKIAFTLNVMDVFLDIDTAVPLGLIINELVTNSLKHAFSGKEEGEISIFLSQISEEDFELKIRDDGNGIPEDFNIENQGSLGLQIVTLLAEKQLHGSLSVNRNGGTEFCLVFKKAKHRKIK